jgi:hypothetical protein
MMKHICWFLVLALAGCADVPNKYQSRQIDPCRKPAFTSLKGVPYQRGSREACAVAVAPFDAGAWYEAPYNSRKIRDQKTVELGCLPLTLEAGGSSGLPGHSQSLMLNFDSSVYPEKSVVRRAVLAVYAFENQRGLYEAELRGRLNVGGELQSLARHREAWGSQSDEGWVLFDITSFAARAINERRNSVHFELSRPCRAADQPPVTVGLLDREPRLLVEFE